MASRSLAPEFVEALRQRLYLESLAATAERRLAELAAPRHAPGAPKRARSPVPSTAAAAAATFRDEVCALRSLASAGATLPPRMLAAALSSLVPLCGGDGAVSAHGVVTEDEAHALEAAAAAGRESTGVCDLSLLIAVLSELGSALDEAGTSPTATEAATEPPPPAEVAASSSAAASSSSAGAGSSGGGGSGRGSGRSVGGVDSGTDSGVNDVARACLPRLLAATVPLHARTEAERKAAAGAPSGGGRQGAEGVYRRSVEALVRGYQLLCRLLDGERLVRGVDTLEESLSGTVPPSTDVRSIAAGRDGSSTTLAAWASQLSAQATSLSEPHAAVAALLAARALAPTPNEEGAAGGRGASSPCARANRALQRAAITCLRAVYPLRRAELARLLPPLPQEVARSPATAAAMSAALRCPSARRNAALCGLMQVALLATPPLRRAHTLRALLAACREAATAAGSTRAASRPRREPVPLLSGGGVHAGLLLCAAHVTAAARAAIPFVATSLQRSAAFAARLYALGADALSLLALAVRAESAGRRPSGEAGAACAVCAQLLAASRELLLACVDARCQPGVSVSRSALSPPLAGATCLARQARRFASGLKRDGEAACAPPHREAEAEAEAEIGEAAAADPGGAPRTNRRATGSRGQQPAAKRRSSRVGGRGATTARSSTAGARRALL